MVTGAARRQGAEVQVGHVVHPAGLGQVAIVADNRMLQTRQSPEKRGFVLAPAWPDIGLVEAAGIEPASDGPRPLALHA